MGQIREKSNVGLVSALNPQVAGNTMDIFSKMLGNMLEGNIIPVRSTEGRKTA
jgi:hypothetical protein